MATLPAFLKRTEALRQNKTEDARPQVARAVKCSSQLRALPQDDVFFYCKKIDNSRLVREADPQARGDCWSAIGAACVILALLTGVAAPSVTNTMEGYKLESLRAEYQRLLDEKRTLQLEEAELLSPGRLEELAKKQNLVTPQSGQVVHLEDHSKPESAALIVK
jgi:cell division protein FtsL